jgi:hypothetical protein
VKPSLLIIFSLILSGWASATNPTPPLPENHTPDAPKTQESPPPPAEPSGLLEIPQTHEDAYFAKKPQTFLIDPQLLLPQRLRQQRESFLRYHSDDSSIDLRIYLIDATQHTPARTRIDAMMRAFFQGNKPTALIFYPLGAPDRATLHLNTDLAAAIPDAEIKRALSHSIMQAREKSDPASQLEAFLVQMSIRLYWMERLLENSSHPKPSDSQPSTPTPSNSPAPSPSFQDSITSKLQPLLDAARPHTTTAAWVASISGLILISLIWSRLRAPHILPDFSIEPRLGGNHAAGVGATITFTDPSTPPAAQRTFLE